MISAQKHYSEKVDIYRWESEREEESVCRRQTLADLIEIVVVSSFGVILWEMFTSEMPYLGQHPIQVAFSIGKGERLTIPPTCPKPFEHLIRSCWNQDPSQRPSFAAILKCLDDLVPRRS